MVSVLLSVDQLRQHVETDLEDDALQYIIDSEEAEIIRRFGDHTYQREVIRGYHLSKLILSRVPQSITQITDGDVIVASTAYKLWGPFVERVSGGWGTDIVVEYVPRDDRPQRRIALVEMCKLRIASTGRHSETIGDFKYVKNEWAERERILRQIAPAGGLGVS